MDLPAYSYFLAMTHWQLGHHEQARYWYDRSTRTKNWRMHDWIRRYVTDWQIADFREEAAELLGIEADKADAEDITPDTETKN